MVAKRLLTMMVPVLGVVLALAMCVGLSGNIAMAQCPDDDEFTTDFRLGDCTFMSGGANPYFSLQPGYQLVLEGEEDGEFIRVVATVLNELEMIDLEEEGIGMFQTRVVEEREWVGESQEDLELAEVSRNFFARCKETNAIYYFGEDVDNYEDGVIVNNLGSWRAGENGALPGMIMPGTFLLGSKYFQERAWDDEAADRAENVEMGLDISVDAGEFQGCVLVVDTNPIEGICKRKDGDVKIYCPGIGLTVDEELELVDYGFNIFDLNDE